MNMTALPAENPRCTIHCSPGEFMSRSPEASRTTTSPDRPASAQRFAAVLNAAIAVARADAGVHDHSGFSVLAFG